MDLRHFPAALLLFLCCAAPAARAADDGAARIKALRENHAKKAWEQSRKYANHRCFFAAREYMLLCEALDTENERNGKMKAFLAFVPVVPWKAFPKPPGPSAFADDPALKERGHQITADLKAVYQFWTRHLDRRVSAYLEALEKAGRQPGQARPAGEAALGLLGLAERLPPWGKARALDRVRPFLEGLGWRFGQYKYKWPRWLNPREAKEAAAREGFRKRRKKAVDAALAACGLAQPGTWHDAPSSVGRSLGVTTGRAVAERFVVEGLPRARARVLLALLQRVRTELGGLTGRNRPNRTVPPVHVCVLPDGKTYGRFVDSVGELAPSGKAAVKELSTGYADYDRSIYGCYVEVLDHTFYAQCATGAVKLLLDHLGFFNWPLWLWAGAADAAVLAALGDVAPTVGAAKGKATPKFQPWYDTFRWMPDMARAAARGRAPSTQSVLARNNEFEVAPVQRAKMYCLFRFLASRPADLETVAGVIAREGWTLGDDGEYAALKAAGWTLAALDRDWKEFMASAPRTPEDSGD